MDASTSVTTPVDEVDQLINQTADEFGLQSSLHIMNANAPSTVAGTPAAPVSDDLEARLAALRNG